MKMRKHVLSAIAITSLMSVASAQTNPTPFDLSIGDFSFTQWAPETPAGVFPAHMAFHVTENPTSGTYNLNANGTGDWNCAYNLTVRNRFIGLGADGVAMRATGSPQWDNCSGGEAAESRYVGAVVLALNTTGRQNISVEWTGGTVTVGDGDPNPRIFALRMQYRLSTSGTWTDVPGNAEYVTQTEGASQNLVTTLPQSCENQALVQLRWVYHQHTSGSGTRPELRLDDVEVSSVPQGGTNIQNAAGRSVLRVFPNPSESGVFQLSAKVSGTVYNMLGSPVRTVTASDRIDLSEKRAGIYMLRTEEGAVIRLMR